jgi:hypothetical protein
MFRPGPYPSNTDRDNARFKYTTMLMRLIHESLRTRHLSGNPDASYVSDAIMYLLAGASSVVISPVTLFADSVRACRRQNENQQASSYSHRPRI